MARKPRNRKVARPESRNTTKTNVVPEAKRVAPRRRTQIDTAEWTRLLIGMVGIGLGVLAFALSIIAVIVKACMAKR